MNSKDNNKKSSKGISGFLPKFGRKDKTNTPVTSKTGASKAEKQPKVTQNQIDSKPKKGGKTSGNRADKTGQKTKNSQVKTVDSALLQFGPIVSEFLMSNNLGKKKISAEYDHETNTWTKITFTFSTLKEGGLSFGEPVIMEKDKYMSQRASLVRSSDSNPHWLSFVASLFRVGIDITDTHPQVEIKKIFGFIRKNLSPIELEIIKFPQRDYDSVDVKKLEPVLKQELDKFKAHYPNQDRIAYLKGAINGTIEIQKDIDWNLYSMAPYSKASVLKDFRVKNDINTDVMTRLANFSDVINNMNTEQPNWSDLSEEQ
jgi:hypothetical protein